MRNHFHTISGTHVCGSEVGFKSGAEGIRTPDPLIANEVRYQLRYSPNHLGSAKPYRIV